MEGKKGAREDKKGTREGKKGVREGKKGAAPFYFGIAWTLKVVMKNVYERPNWKEEFDFLRILQERKHIKPEVQATLIFAWCSSSNVRSWLSISFDNVL